MIDKDKLLEYGLTFAVLAGAVALSAITPSDTCDYEFKKYKEKEKEQMKKAPERPHYYSGFRVVPTGCCYGVTKQELYSMILDANLGCFYTEDALSILARIKPENYGCAMEVLKRSEDFGGYYTLQHLRKLC